MNHKTIKLTDLADSVIFYYLHDHRQLPNFLGKQNDYADKNRREHSNHRDQ